MLPQQCLDLLTSDVQSKPREKPGLGDRLHGKHDPQWKHTERSCTQSVGTPLYLAGRMKPKFVLRAIYVSRRQIVRPLESQAMQLGSNCCIPVKNVNSLLTLK